MNFNSFDKLSLKEIFQRFAKKPDRELYNYFFDKYYPKLIWFALLFVKQHSLAEEVVSDVMMNIFRKREKLAESDNIEGYIFISVKNQSLKLLKKNKRHVFTENFENDQDLLMTTNISPEFEYLENEFYQIIKAAIDSLPPKRKLVFNLIKEEGVKYQDVATLLGLSVKTVETHMGLALKTIHTCIRQYREDQANNTKIYSIGS